MASAARCCRRRCPPTSLDHSLLDGQEQWGGGNAIQHPAPHAKRQARQPSGMRGGVNAGRRRWRASPCRRQQRTVRRRTSAVCASSQAWRISFCASAMPPKSSNELRLGAADGDHLARPRARRLHHRVGGARSQLPRRPRRPDSGGAPPTHGRRRGRRRADARLAARHRPRIVAPEHQRRWRAVAKREPRRAAAARRQ